MNLSLKNIIIGGGGYRGFAYIGALLELLDNGLLDNIERLCGVSVGALICFLFNICQDSNEIYSLITSNKFVCKNDIDITQLFTEYGLDKGNTLDNLIKSIIQKKFNKDDITFDELYEYTDKKLYICATNITKAERVLFSVDNHPSMSVPLALRLSTLIPIYFTRKKYNNDYYVDGGLSDNFPIPACFNLDDTIGIQHDKIQDREDNFITYLLSIVSSFSNPVLPKYMIRVNTKINLLEFDISNDKIINEISKGRQACKEYLKNC